MHREPGARAVVEHNGLALENGRLDAIHLKGRLDIMHKNAHIAVYLHSPVGRGAGDNPESRRELPLPPQLLVGTGGADQYVLDCDIEFIFIAKGSLEVLMGDDLIELDEGDALTIPGRAPHTWRNASSTQPCEVLWMLAPAP